MCSDIAVIIASVGSQIRLRCASRTTIKWSTHSRRIDPVSRSAKSFYQGEAGAPGLSLTGGKQDNERDSSITDFATSSVTGSSRPTSPKLFKAMRPVEGPCSARTYRRALYVQWTSPSACSDLICGRDRFSCDSINCSIDWHLVRAFAGITMLALVGSIYTADQLIRPTK
jgi:hypothetical protein